MDDEIVESSQPEGYRCRKCGKEYKSKSGLTKHMKNCRIRTPHPASQVSLAVAGSSADNTGNSPPAASKQYTLCKRCFASKSSLTKHMKTSADSSRRRCRYYEATYNTYAGLSTHESRTHKDEETAKAGEEVTKTSQELFQELARAEAALTPGRPFYRSLIAATGLTKDQIRHRREKPLYRELLEIAATEITRKRLELSFQTLQTTDTPRPRIATIPEIIDSSTANSQDSAVPMEESLHIEATVEVNVSSAHSNNAHNMNATADREQQPPDSRDSMNVDGSFIQPDAVSIRMEPPSPPYEVPTPQPPQQYERTPDVTDLAINNQLEPGAGEVYQVIHQFDLNEYLVRMRTRIDGLLGRPKEEYAEVLESWLATNFASPRGRNGHPSTTRREATYRHPNYGQRYTGSSIRAQDLYKKDRNKLADLIFAGRNILEPATWPPTYETEQYFAITFELPSGEDDAPIMDPKTGEHDPLPISAEEVAKAKVRWKRFAPGPDGVTTDQVKRKPDR